MKAIYAAVAFLSGLVAALLVAALLLLWPARVPAPAARGPAAVPGDPSSGAGADRQRAEVDQLRADLALLGERIGSLTAELELLRTAVQRRPVEAPGASAGEAPPSAHGDAQRQTDAQLLARAREQEAARRAQERAQREERMISERAGLIAERLGLGAADRLLLGAHLRSESERRLALIDRSRQPDYDRELLRDEFVALGEWSEQHLLETFGAELAARIRLAERETRGAAAGLGADMELGREP